MIRRNEILLLFVILFSGSLMAQSAVENFSLVGIKKNNISQKQLYYNINGEFPTYLMIFDGNNQTMIDLPETNVITEAYLNGFAQYGISSAINVYVNIPFMWLTHYSPAINKKNRGFGDIEIGGVYQILGKSLTETTLNLQLSVITPTGENKNLAPSEIPLGIGAWQIVAAAQGSFPFNSFNLNYYLSYNFRTENNSNVELGDGIAGILSAEKKLVSSWGKFSFEGGIGLANYFENSVNGNNIAGTSEFSARAFVGAGFYYADGLRFDLTVPFTIYKYDAWLTDYSVILKVEHSFDFNN